MMSKYKHESLTIAQSVKSGSGSIKPVARYSEGFARFIIMTEDYFNDFDRLSTNEDSTPIIPDVDYDFPTATNGAKDVGDCTTGISTNGVSTDFNSESL